MIDLLTELPEDLRAQALTHPAFATERPESYERLEFLGDSVLDLVVTDAIFGRHPELSEGELSKIRAAAVSRDACAEVARAHGLGAAMIEHAAGRGSAHHATAERLAEQRNALAALTESVVGATFLAHGYDRTAAVVLAAFEERLAHALTHRTDAKSELQELASREGASVLYEELDEAGPPHDRRFTFAALLRDVQDEVPRGSSSSATMRAEGSGRSKQEAQQAAAAALLMLMERE